MFLLTKWLQIPIMEDWWVIITIEISKSWSQLFYRSQLEGSLVECKNASLPNDYVLDYLASIRELVEIEIDYASEVDISMRVSLRIKSWDDAVAVKFDKTLRQEGG